MVLRTRIRQLISFRDRLAVFAEEARRKAARLPPGSERDTLLEKARQAEVAQHLDRWANSSGLQPPK